MVGEFSRGVTGGDRIDDGGYFRLLLAEVVGGEGRGNG